MNKLISILPVYRVNDLEENLEFFCKFLGMKVLLADGPMIYLSGKDEKEAGLILEESREKSGYRAAGDVKKQDYLTIFASPAEIEQLLFNHFDQVTAFRTSENTIAFEVLSPEKTVFRLMSGGNVRLNEKVEKEDLSVKENQESYLSSFSAREISLNFQENCDLQKVLTTLSNMNLGSSDFRFAYTGNQASDEKKTWDLEALKFRFSEDVDFSKIRDAFKDFDPYLDAKERILMLELSEGIELWFEK